MTSDQPSPPLESRLGYLLKHAQLRLTEASARALAPFDLDGRELAVLAVLTTGTPLSQVEAAGRLGVDRTTMVALIDALEGKGLVERRRSAEDRRRNTVHPTPVGQERLRQAERAREEMERRFLAPLGEALAADLVGALRTLVGAEQAAADGLTNDN
ncbi:MarR family transcriptional regulator [Kitasatospora nipponensis]|uniref:MarR family transcriptional regulator n=1 Tax=Kitasatospora nipponensis TaxID=258049 RepID=A0ABN1WC89_9ACTN